MAIVYRAVEVTALGVRRPVALKIVRGEHAGNPVYSRMFMDEARTVCQLYHPNIVQTLNVGLVDETLFISMELIRGITLRRLLDLYPDHKLPIEVAAHIGAQIAAALHYAHSCRDTDGHPLNLIHRDVTPENVLITEYGSAKLVDFGIAKATHRATNTLVGHVKGKPRYIAPEQLVGEAFDHRVDLYALGALLYECVSGVRVFDANDLFTVFHRVVHETLPPVSNHLERRQPLLDTLLVEAMAKDPKLRFQTGNEFRHALTPLTMSEEAPDLLRNLERHVRASLPRETDPVSDTMPHKIPTAIREKEVGPRAQQSTASPSEPEGMDPLWGAPTTELERVTGSRPNATPKRLGRGLWLAAGLAMTFLVVLGLATWSRVDRPRARVSAPSPRPATTPVATVSTDPPTGEEPKKTSEAETPAVSATQVTQPFDPGEEFNRLRSAALLALRRRNFLPSDFPEYRALLQGMRAALEEGDLGKAQAQADGFVPKIESQALDERFVARKLQRLKRHLEARSESMSPERASEVEELRSLAESSFLQENWLLTNTRANEAFRALYRN